jgi:hypothetical protein
MLNKPLSITIALIISFPSTAFADGFNAENYWRELCKLDNDIRPFGAFLMEPAPEGTKETEMYYSGYEPRFDYWRMGISISSDYTPAPPQLSPEMPPARPVTFTTKPSFATKHPRLHKIGRKIRRTCQIIQPVLNVANLGVQIAACVVRR